MTSWDYFQATDAIKKNKCAPYFGHPYPWVNEKVFLFSSFMSFALAEELVMRRGLWCNNHNNWDRLDSDAASYHFIQD